MDEHGFLSRILGSIALIALCTACAEKPATIVATEEPVPDVAVADARQQAPAPQSESQPAPSAGLLPDPHGYSRWHLKRGDYKGEAGQPAYVKLLLAQDHWSTELAASSGNGSFDQAAIDAASHGQYQVALDAAGSPAYVLICFDSNNACPAGPPWTGPEHLRSWSNIQAGLDRLKGGLLKVYSDAVARGDITPEGKLTVNLSIEPSGAVSHCAIAQSSYTNEAFNKAFTEQSCNLNFGAGGYDRSFIYGYPVEFHPGGAAY
jgi:hypothetical protein